MRGFILSLVIIGSAMSAGGAPWVRPTLAPANHDMLCSAGAKEFAHRSRTRLARLRQHRQAPAALLSFRTANALFDSTQSDSLAAALQPTPFVRGDASDAGESPGRLTSLVSSPVRLLLHLQI